MLNKGQLTKSIQDMRNNKIRVFYTQKQVLTKNIDRSYSKSPLKPMLLMQNFERLGISQHMDIDGTFAPFVREEFLIAHTAQYVDAVLTGNDIHLRSSNSLPWSRELAETVKYTSASLYNAIKYSIENPSTPCLATVSGFHHARPTGGSGFCTFAGQVIASVKLYREKGVRGCYFDLDGHFGNSIEDCRAFQPDINKAVPIGFNVNPQGENEEYYYYLLTEFDRVEEAILAGEIDYVVWCHGADSHEHDDLGGQVNTEYWVKCADIFYKWVRHVDEKLASAGRAPLPVSMALFGGYRNDSYESVLSLHTKDTVLCLNTLCGQNINYEAQVVEK
jgi:acetoin utilization deacetylase AcuC-like enzyme